jgi:FkbM family methyltransferase
MKNYYGIIKENGFKGTIQIIYVRLIKFKWALIIYVLKIRTGSNYVTKTIQGSIMDLNLNDVGISQELFISGVHESESTKQTKKEIKPGMTVLEIGANIGYYALIEASIVGSKGKIYAFEPSPNNYVDLKNNISLNGYTDRFELFDKGVGSKSGNLKLVLMNKGNMSSFYNREDGGGIENNGSVNVEVVTIDEMFFDKKIKIDYCRMDVEGYEIEIIKGMDKLLKSQFAPSKFFIEVHSSLFNENNYTCKGFLEQMAQYGYDISISRYRGKADICVYSKNELLNHPLCEKGYWETFFYKLG